ncbi:DUF4258 domain-containing protein [Micrococcus luteus]|uniref:DUF4258 domain-containing protein n=1 Tax=Micrococcus luteus TaxID=1270 RepID=UPI0011A67549|nr:DUF4258 domain-containing protein [Micrococcus luteus]
MGVTFSGHALQRMSQRGITAQEVREVLTPHRIIQTRPGQLPGRVVHLVELPDGRRIEVVTTPPVKDCPPGGSVTVVSVWEC